MKSLNHIFRTIWSEALGAWIAVSEITRTKGKRSASSLIRAIRVASGNAARDNGDFNTRLKPVYLAVALCFAFGAQANPMGGTVVNGQASFNTSGNTLTVTNTPGTIINWQGFSINANEVTHFAQQSASSTVLNHVVSNNPSVILGTLSSNGQVFLVNANGIMFGAGSTVDVAGLVATSLNLSDADFLAGRHNYTAVAGAQNVSNAGNINAQQGGQIYLIAPNVENNGIITAPNGEILLAAGNSVELVNSNDPNLRVKITAPAGDATNLGQLIVESGSLGLFGTVVRNSGSVSADSATMQGGKIVFRATQRVEAGGTISAQGAGGGEIKMLADMQNGTVNVTGTLDASAPNSGDGGFIDTSAAHVQVADSARVTTEAANGASGNWLIDPTDFTIAATDPLNGSSYMSNTALGTALAAGNVTIQTLASGTGNGDIFVNDVVGWTTTSGLATTLTLNAYRDVNVNAAISSAGATLGIAPGSLNLHADMTGTGVGTVNFGASGSISLVSGGASPIYGTANIFYNPVSYTSPTSYTSFIINGTLWNGWMLVNNPANLQAINTNLTGTYALGTNIDMTGVTGFTPIGNPSPFTGRFNGDGHTISNLSITGDGLFSTIGAGGLVANVGLINSSVVASASSVGALAGSNFGTISNSYVSNGTVTVTGAFWGVGGLVGSNSGSIVGSHVSGGTVYGEYGHIGGLAGENATGGTIDSSYVENINVVNAASFATSAGGMVGNNGGAISNSYVNGGSVSSTASGQVGGLVGYNTGSVSTSYASNGSLSSTGVSVGGPVGGVAGTNFGTITNSYWDTNTTGALVGAGTGTGALTNVVGLTTAQTMAGASFVGFDFGTVWWMSDTNTRPFLQSEYSIAITNAHQLQLMAMDPTANYKLANDIDLTSALAAGGMWSSAGFVQLGDPLVLPYGFTGQFDGGGNTITGLYINRPTTNYVGLFGYVNTGGTINNVGLVNANVTGQSYVGGLAGYTSSTSTVSNSHVTGGSVTGTSFVGALVGAAYSSVFTNVYASSNVTGTDVVGGLIGEITLGSINNSYVSGGSVTGTTVVGGLIGRKNGVPITNSHYNINAVTINGANAVMFGGLYNDSTANGNGVGQFTDWLNGGMSLNIANYTAANGGSLGTAGANSYTIGTVQGMKDLLGFADNAAYTFTLTNNVAMTAGVYVPYLAADFNGAGFTISNLNINQTFGSSLGLFGYIAAGSTVSNVALTNASVTGGSRAGSLAGVNEGTITNSHSTAGTISGATDVGGLVGYNLDGSIGSSYVSGGTVDGAVNVGGLVGQNAGSASLGGGITAGFITASYVDGGTVVTGSASGSRAGGLVGLNAGGSIDGSYVSAGNVNGNSNVGGLVGQNGYVGEVSSITNSYVDTATTVAGVNNIGGLVGYDSGEGILQGNSVTNTTVTGTSYVGGLAGILATAFSSPGYATDNHVVNSTVTGSSSFAGGLAGSNGKAVTNSYVTGTTVNGVSDVGGLVGYVNTGGSIGNSFVSGGSVIGSAVSGNNAGGLAGTNSGTITNTYASGISVSGRINVGGLVGNNTFPGAISLSYADASSVTGTSIVGGVVGYNYQGSVTNTFWNSALAVANGIANDFNIAGATDVGAARKTLAELMSISTYAGWDIASTGGAGMTWRIYEGQTSPLLTSFLTPLTVTANNATAYDNGGAYSGGNGVSYSVSTAGPLVFGTPVYGGTSQGAVDLGSYSISVSGLYSSQLGYDIAYVDGVLTIISAPVISLQTLSELVSTTLLTPGDRDKKRGIYGERNAARGAASVEVPMLACRQ